MRIPAIANDGGADFILGVEHFLNLKPQAAIFEIALGAIGDGLFAVGSVKMTTLDAVKNAQAIAVAGSLDIAPIIVKPQPEYDPTANQQV